MKAVFGILALFLVAANAGVVEQPVNYETLINNIINEGKHVAIDSVHELEHQVEIIVLDPLHQIEEALDKIEARVEEDEACVAAQNPYVESVVSDMHSEMSHCGVVAAQDTAEIAIDVSSAAQQLVFGGYDCLTTYNKCQAYKNSILKKTCMANFTIKASLFLIKARSSIKTIKAAPARVPVVFGDADTCTHTAADHALLEFETVHKNIDACVGKY